MKHAMAVLSASPFRWDELKDDKRIFNAMIEACHNCKLTVMGTIKHEFHPQGLTAVVLLAESHMAVHTYPERGQVFVDVFTCGGQDPRYAVAELAQLLTMAIGDVKLVERDTVKPKREEGSGAV